VERQSQTGDSGFVETGTAMRTTGVEKQREQYGARQNIRSRKARKKNIINCALIPC
jgi:hypothetical protein